MLHCVNWLRKRHKLRWKVKAMMTSSGMISSPCPQRPFLHVGGWDSWGRGGGQPVRRGVPLSCVLLLRCLPTHRLWSGAVANIKKGLLSPGGKYQEYQKAPGAAKFSQTYVESTAEISVGAGAEHQRLWEPVVTEPLFFLEDQSGTTMHAHLKCVNGFINRWGKVAHWFYV